MAMPARLRDPRYLQLAFLSLLLLYGNLFRSFEIPSFTIFTILGAAVLAQSAAILLLGLPWTSLLSAGITGLSLTLLLRANDGWVLGLFAVLAVASKFLLRVRGKHVYNPTALVIALGCLFTDVVWVTPSQWGAETLLAFWMLGLGLAVSRRSRRDDVSLAFLVAHVALHAARVAYLGQRWAVLEHQLTSGALLLFTFFMISDPRSTPDHRASRILFGAGVAALAYWIRFTYYTPYALFYALFFLSPLTPVLDSLWTHPRFEWQPGGSDAKVTHARVSHPFRRLAFLRLRSGVLWILRREGGRDSL